MADKRMFSKSIIDSDAFLEMPQSSQNLYFHLSMRADDDGFINNPKSIMRIVGCKDDDVNILLAKKFLIIFESGVVVIKHWKIHNYIAKDRYAETNYKEEKSRLMLDENKAYTLSENIPYTDCIQVVDTLSTQVRLDKIRLDKIREEESSTEGKPPTPYSEIQNLFNSICISYPKLKTLSDTRKKAIKARLNTYSLDDFKNLFEKAEQSDFLKGKNDRNWIAVFDWLIKDANMAKVLDGNYDNKQAIKKDIKNYGTVL